MNEATERTRDFFISYAAADRAWAEWIAWQLESADYTTYFQAWDFTPGENFVEAMSRALGRSGRAIAVLSSDYLASRFGESEWRFAFSDDPTGERGLLIPVRVQECALPPQLATRIYIDLVGVDEQTASARLLSGVKAERRKPERAPRFPIVSSVASEEPIFPGDGPRVNNLPTRNSTFTDRAAILELLYTNLSPSKANHSYQPQILHGLGGVGKTQIALEFAHRHVAMYDVIWWVSAESTIAVNIELAALASRIGVGEGTRSIESATAVLSELQRRHRWLVVFDNVSDPKGLVPYLPASSDGRILITTRNPSWKDIGNLIPVEVPSREESIEFLRNRIRMPEGLDAERLAAELGDLPLALEQASAYIENTGISISAYLERLASNQGDLLHRGVPTGYPATVGTTWKLALKEIASATPAAIELLKICAFLAPDAIPLELFITTSDTLPPSLGDAARDRLALDDAVARLRQYSMVDRDRTGLRMHRLVQAVVIQDLDVSERNVWLQRAIELLLAAWPRDVSYPTSWQRCAQLLPHVMSTTGYAEQQKLVNNAVITLLGAAGSYLYQQGHLDTSKVMFERSLAIVQTERVPDLPGMARTLGNLGLVLRDLGDLEAARTSLERALTIQETAHGPYHSDVARTLGNLGLVLRDLGDLEAARASFERSLSLFSDVIGPGHPITAQALERLGLVLHDLGDLEAARTCLERALAVQEAALGPDHPDTLRALSRLANAFADLGEVSLARGLAERALSGQRRVLDDNHPDIQSSLSVLNRISGL
jgi:tetratricopeptide (TPR) repeat protein